MPAYSEPYSTLLNAVAGRLVNAGADAGPFDHADQVKLWVDEALDELMPSDELKAELSRDVPIALVCDGGSRPGPDSPENSDGVDEQQTVKVYFCASSPTMVAAITGDGTKYWGTGAIKHWVLSRLAARTWATGITGWEPLKWVETRPVAVPQVGRAIMVATFTSLRQQAL